MGDTVPNYVRYVRMLEEAGVAFIGCGDSQSLYHEMFVRCTLAAANIRRARVDTWVANPV